MEGTLSSSINKALSSKQTVIDHDSPDEESGWTAYFDDLDFPNNNNNIVQQQHSAGSYSCSSSNPSLISDAASCAPWKVTNIACASPNMPKKLSFRKSRTNKISYLDDSLEDTASSPVNSPKGKGASFDHQNSKLQSNEGNEMINYECQDLKKRGLCLVPFSMFVNYLG